jgi:hypothetical protein
MTGRRSRCVAFARELAILSATTAGLFVVGLGRLHAPPLLEPWHLAAWWQGELPIDSLFGAARAALLCAALIRIGVLVLVFASFWCGRLGFRAARLVVRLRLVEAKRAARLGIGVSASASAGLALGACGSGMTLPAGPAPVIIGLPVSHHPHAPPSPGTAAVRPAPGVHRTATGRRAQAGAARPTAAAPPTGSLNTTRSSLSTQSHSDRWTVQPGDNLWSISRRALAAHLGREPSDDAVVGYWLDLIHANRSRLPYPADPSLILPGAVLSLPPWSP